MLLLKINLFKNYFLFLKHFLKMSLESNLMNQINQFTDINHVAIF